MPALNRAHGSPYGYAHRKRREGMVRAAIGTLCPGDFVNGEPYRSPRCHGVMTNPRMMHLAHSLPVSLGGEQGDRINCAPCNLGAGAILGNQMRRPRRTPPMPTAHRRTRAW